MEKKQIELVAELFDIKVRRLQNGHKLRLEFEKPQDKDLNAALVYFRHETVDINVTQNHVEKEKDRIVLEGSYEVFDIKCRTLRNGDKLKIALECVWKKEAEFTAVSLRFQECKLFMDIVEQDLFDEEDPE
jgi:tRNA(Phe) wybutosine-synthesizing methylase Tyw3